MVAFILLLKRHLVDFQCSRIPNEWRRDLLFALEWWNDSGGNRDIPETLHSQVWILFLFLCSRLQHYTVVCNVHFMKCWIVAQHSWEKFQTLQTYLELDTSSSIHVWLLHISLVLCVNHHLEKEKFTTNLEVHFHFTDNVLK